MRDELSDREWGVIKPMLPSPWSLPPRVETVKGRIQGERVLERAARDHVGVDGRSISAKGPSLGGQGIGGAVAKAEGRLAARAWKLAHVIEALVFGIWRIRAARRLQGGSRSGRQRSSRAVEVRARIAANRI